jgi:hypothetical protein
VHKGLLAVVVADLTADGEDAFERRQFGSTPAQLLRMRLRDQPLARRMGFGEAQAAFLMAAAWPCGWRPRARSAST